MTIGIRFLALFDRLRSASPAAETVASPADSAGPADKSALYGIDLRDGIASLKVTDPNYQKMEEARRKIINDVQHSDITKIEDLFAGFRSPKTKKTAARDLMWSALDYHHTSLEMIEYLGSIGGVSETNFNRMANASSLDDPASVKKLKFLGSMISQEEKDEAVQRTTEQCLEYLAGDKRSLAKYTFPEIKFIIAVGANPDAQPYKNSLSARTIADEAYILDFPEVNTAILDGLKLQREWRAEAMGHKPVANPAAKLVAV